MMWPVIGLMGRNGGTSYALVCVCTSVAIGSSFGRCNNSACAANVSTSGAYTLICSGSPPLLVGSSLILVLVSDGGAGVCGLAIPVEGDCIVTFDGCRRASSAACNSAHCCLMMARSWSSSGPCWSTGSWSVVGMLQLRSSPAGRTVIQYWSIGSQVEIPGPVAATGKNTQPNWTTTGKDWTSSCSCLKSKPVQLQLSHFEESRQPMKNRLQPVIWWILCVSTCSVQNKPKNMQNGPVLREILPK
jgi:hypothetical protein